MMDSEITEKNRRFYDEYVADLIHTKFGQYEDRIAVGIAGEGSDCFGYDDLISRDHDFGTGVCLWVTNEDMDRFGYTLSIAYNELADTKCNAEAWEGTRYHPERLNYKDKVVSLIEETATEIVELLIACGLTAKRDPYLESYVNEVLQK